MIAIGSDHAGYRLKEHVKEYLDKKGLAYQDFGTCDEKSCDYPEFANKVCEAVLSGGFERGILVCGTGVGMSMAANRHKGIRAACVSDTFSARATRMHNNANVLCIGERVVGSGLAEELLDAFLFTEYEGGRHQRRVDLLDEGASR